MTPQTRSDPRKRAILEAALECFSTDGYDAASIEDICAISGASVGSVYHHFGNKEGIASALYEEGIIGYQADLVTIVAAGGTPEQLVAAIVRHHLRWVRENQAFARYLLRMGAAPATAAARPAVQRHNDELLRRVELWLRPQAAAGRILDVPATTLVALVLGPCHAVARAWLAGASDLDNATIELVAAATVRAVRHD